MKILKKTSNPVFFGLGILSVLSFLVFFGGYVNADCSLPGGGTVASGDDHQMYITNRSTNCNSKLNRFKCEGNNRNPSGPHFNSCEPVCEDPNEAPGFFYVLGSEQIRFLNSFSIDCNNPTNIDVYVCNPDMGGNWKRKPNKGSSPSDIKQTFSKCIPKCKDPNGGEYELGTIIEKNPYNVSFNCDGEIENFECRETRPGDRNWYNSNGKDINNYNYFHNECKNVCPSPDHPGEPSYGVVNGTVEERYLKPFSNDCIQEKVRYECINGTRHGNLTPISSTFENCKSSCQDSVGNNYPLDYNGDFFSAEKSNNCQNIKKNFTCIKNGNGLLQWSPLPNTSIYKTCKNFCSDNRIGGNPLDFYSQGSGIIAFKENPSEDCGTGNQYKFICSPGGFGLVRREEAGSNIKIENTHANCGILKAVCGNNADSYGALETGWKQSSDIGFCSSGVSLGGNPIFPSSTERSGGTTVSWTCTNGPTSTDCSADISELKPCGTNAATYSSFEENWKIGDKFPNPSTGFCQIGVPGWEKDVLFPSTLERSFTKIIRKRYCAIGNDKGAICEANISPIHDGKCGVNATTYDFSKTTWSQNSDIGFCGVGNPEFSTNSDFDRVRSSDVIKNRKCKSPDLGKDINCQAVLKKNKAECSNAENQSILNINLFDKNKLCSVGLPNMMDSTSIMNPWNRKCQVFSSDDDMLIDYIDCSAHKSCTWNNYEYPHNKETIPVPIDGACGPANGYNFSITDSWYGEIQQCSSGKPDNFLFPSIDTKVSWKCLGINGGKDSDYCSSSRFSPVIGECGGANGYIFGTSDIGYSIDKNQCSKGKPTNKNFPKIGSTESWKCIGEYGGVGETCWATRIATGTKINGECGGADGYIFEKDDSRYTTDYNQCNSGIPSDITFDNSRFPEPGGTVNWTCKGLNGGSDSKICSTSRKLGIILTGKCGSSNGQIYEVDLPIKIKVGNLCENGTPTVSVSDFHFNGPDYRDNISWSCVGTGGGGNDDCGTWQNTPNIKQGGLCGKASGHTFSYQDNGYTSGFQQCLHGTSSNFAFPEPGKVVDWSCKGKNGIFSSCSAKRKIEVCGPASLKVYNSVSEIDTNDYCLRGTPTNIKKPKKGNSVSWLCIGDEPGLESNICTTRVEAGEVSENGECGPASLYAFKPSDVWYTTDYYQCKRGIPTKIIFPQAGETIKRECIGPNGGNNSETCSTKKQTVSTFSNGECGNINGYTYLPNSTGRTGINEYGNEVFSGINNLCKVGSVDYVPPFPKKGQTVTRVCKGIGGGNDSEICSTSHDPGIKTFEFIPGGISFWYKSNKPNLGESCEDIKIIGNLTCDDGTWMSGTQIMQDFAEYCEDNDNQTCIFNGKIINNGDIVSAYKRNYLDRGVDCDSSRNFEKFKCEWGKLVPLNGNGHYKDYDYFSCENGKVRNCELGVNFGNKSTVMHGKTFYGYKKGELERDQDCSTTGDNGNMALLECWDGDVRYKKTKVETEEYQSLSCINREPKDCVFNEKTIKHLSSITGWNLLQPGINQSCLYQVRKCIDGVLSGDYQYDHCGTLNGKCGESSSGKFTEKPKYNLCEQGKVNWPDNDKVAEDKRTWQCLGYGGKNQTCFADKIISNDNVKPKCVNYDKPVFYLHNSQTDKLCISGEVKDFKKTNTGRNRNCVGTTQTIPCDAINDIIPEAKINYSTILPTNGPVSAKLTGFNFSGIKILNNSGNNEHIFEKNGEFEFKIGFDGKTGTVLAKVDRINKRQNIWEDLLGNYEKNLCPLYQRIKFQDLHTDPYSIYIQTMLNNCVMHGYKFSNRNLFLPKNKLTKLEALTVLSRLGSSINHYYGDRLEDKRNDRYKSIFINDELAAHITWASNLGVLQHLKQKNITQNIRPKNHPLNQDLIILKDTIVESDSVFSPGTILSKGTKFVKGIDLLDEDPEVISGWKMSGMVFDQRESKLLDDFEYKKERILDKYIVAKIGSIFKSGTKFTNNIVLQKSGILVDWNKSVTKKEFENMLSHFLRIHGLDYHLKDRLFSEIDFKHKDYITRGETAFVLSRLLESYKGVPVGNDYLFLNAVYEKIKNYSVQDSINFMYQLQRALSRINKPMLNNYGLTKRRLISDIDSIRKNKTPNRKNKLNIDMDILKKRWQDRRNIDAFWQDGVLKFYNKDRYDEIDF